MSQNLSLFDSVPRYCIRLVTESQVFYDGKKMSNAALVAEFLMSIGLHEKAQEEFYSLYLNTKNKIVGFEMVSRGTLNSSLVHPREVFKGAILANAHAIILAHNHPSGEVDPSIADKVVTEKLSTCGSLMEIQILDHVVIGSTGRYFSFREQGLLNN